MGVALAAAVTQSGHEAVVVSGPVSVNYPAGVEVHRVVSTEEMLAECEKLFPTCDGLIAVAAPCDYRPTAISTHKIHKSGDSLHIELVETPDIVAELSRGKKTQWMVAFALETEDQHLRAMRKMERKQCDLIVLNGPEAIQADQTSVEVLGKDGRSRGCFSGSKTTVAMSIFEIIEQALLPQTMNPMKTDT